MIRIAVLSFPGNNCEVESLRAIKQAGMEAVFFRWNEDRSTLGNIDGYFIPGGFSYEDRGRSGMVAARDPLLDFLHQEAEAGKAIIGNCNGAQILVESGLIPLDRGLRMSLARNVIDSANGPVSTGFLSEWVWITPSCAHDRCATSDWEGSMHVQIAHGEGRFTTRDRDVIDELKKNNQIAFRYCDENGQISDDPIVTPNGSIFAIAGLCNPVGNVVALMPHPERTPLGAPYFASLKRWIEKGVRPSSVTQSECGIVEQKPAMRRFNGTEIFIVTIITNNEERTVEQAARRIVPNLKLSQMRYIALNGKPDAALSDLSTFNPNKEVAFVRMNGTMHRWQADRKELEPTDGSLTEGGAVSLLRRDDPDTGAGAYGEGSETGICYVCRNVPEEKLLSHGVLEIFGNPHASTLTRLA